MKKKILTGLLAISIGVNVLTFSFYYDTKVFAEETTEKLNETKQTVIELKDDIVTKSTEIAKLVDTIENKDSDIKKKDQLIKQQEEQMKKQQQTIESQKKQIANFKKKQEGSDGIRTLTMNASGYIAMCKEQCSGRTRSGYDVRNTIYYNGMRIIASDLSVLPMFSVVEIEGFSERFIVLDTGGAIDGNKIDVLFNSTQEAINFGRKNVKVKVIRIGA